MIMDKITEAQETALQRYLDGTLEGPALQQLKQDLNTSAALQRRLEELRPVHDFLARNTLQSPSSNFVDQVMRNLSRGAITSYPSPRNGLMLLAGVMVASGMLAALLTAGTFDQVSGLLSLNQMEVLKNVQAPELPSVNVNGKLVMKILIGVNLVLAFIVLDRTVLRPFFQRRALVGDR
jgi:anti-sigma factor RsiW